MEWRAAAAPVSHRRGASPGGTRTRSADDRGGSIDAFMSVTAAPAGEDRVAIARFLEMMAAEAGASRNTLLAYSADLGGASELLGGRLAGADEEAVQKLSAHWSALSRATVSRKASALRRRSEARRVGKEWVSTCSSGWSPYH